MTVGGDAFEGAEMAEKMEEAREDNSDMSQLSNDGVELVVVGAA